jgi:hypothetical protein
MEADVRERWMSSFCGLGTDVQYHVHSNTVANCWDGLVRRVFNVEGPNGLEPPPTPRKGIFAEQLEVERGKFKLFVESAAVLSHEEVCDCYTGREKTIKLLATASLHRTPVHKGDARLSTFVKCEKVKKKVLKSLCPRVIQPREQRYIVEVARYLKRLEKPVFEALRCCQPLGPNSLPCVMKGMNAEQMGSMLKLKWDRFKQPVGFGLDAVRYDQHFSRQALEYEHLFYLDYFHGEDRARLAELLSWQVRNVGICRCVDGVIKYQVEGSRMSGDMNTSMGNCLIMCLLITHCMRVCDVLDYELCNNGDDCVVIMETADLVKCYQFMPGILLTFGFNVEMEKPVYCFEKMEFCQMKPIVVDGRSIMVRNLYPTLSKDIHTVLPMRCEKDVKSFFLAIGQCGLSLTGGVPVFQSYYECLIRHGVSSNITRSVGWKCGMTMLAIGMDRKRGVISPDTRVSFYNAFGVPPDEQVLLENRYDLCYLERLMECVPWRSYVENAEPHPSYDPVSLH